MKTFFEQDVIINGKSYKAYKYEEVLKEQLLIGFLSDGIVSINDTNDLPVNDRRILLSTLQKIKDEERKYREELKLQREVRRGKNRFK